MGRPHDPSNVAAGTPLDPSGSTNRGPTLASGSPSNDTSLLGLRLPPDAAHGALLATLTLLFGMLLIGLVVADDAGIGPRHREWRARWTYRFTRR